MQKLGITHHTSSQVTAQQFTVRSGFPGDVNGEQEAALTQLSATLADTLRCPEAMKFVARFGGHNRCLLRWLRFTRFDVALAKRKFEETLKWRIEVGANDILEDPAAIALMERLRRLWPGALCGTSKEGLPVQYVRVGEVKTYDILAEVTEDEMQRFYIYWLELVSARQVTAMAERAAAGQDPLTCRGMLEIYDCSGLSVRQIDTHGLRLLAKMLSMGSTHYPENLYRGFIINAPTVFSMAWKIISPVLNENTRRIMNISSSSCEGPLQELIGDAQLQRVWASVTVSQAGRSQRNVADDSDLPPLEEDHKKLRRNSQTRATRA